MDSQDPPPPRRKKLRRYEVAGDLRFLTFSCYHRLPLFQNDKITDAFVSHLTKSQETLAFKTFAWMLMPTHVHLLVKPNHAIANITAICSNLKRPFAVTDLNRWRTLQASILSKVLDKTSRHHFWQLGGGYDRNIYSDREALEKMKYIHGNPAESGLVERALEWKWSSARFYANLPYVGPPLTCPWY